MKKLFSVILLALACNYSNAQQAKDAQTIKSMCGCYEVKFASAETFSYPQNKDEYEASQTKHETALEWITPIIANDNYFSLQHLLIVSDKMVIKHWRQDWVFENQDQWTWTNLDGRTFWQSTADAPLPRGEYSKRSDYNILKRTNIHEIIPSGWIHNQDNAKIIRENDKADYVLAEEKGYNTYTKVDDSKCVAAQKYWAENEKLWEKVRSKWNKELAKKKDLRFHKKVDSRALYSYLFELPNTATQQEVDTIIDKFIIQ
ncbi:DUF6607 family protein [Sphingobacterium cavernae]|uniref:DUF6607 family protein n=1 Tax=Sphingobacterium cavernae TaxID=2592657 RepID=UPI00122FCB44|nr:DUF6607 family protein [Sphingobacterium cavernae]